MEFGIFILSVLGAFAASGVAAWLFVWPWLQQRSKCEGLSALLLHHAFRFSGLSFFVPGVVGTAMASAFSVPAAWGDFGAAVLAILALVALAKRWSIALPIVWLFN